MGAGMNNIYKETEFASSSGSSVTVWVEAKSYRASYSECVGSIRSDSLTNVLEDKWHSTLERWVKFYMGDVDGRVEYIRYPDNSIAKIVFSFNFPANILTLRLFKGLRKSIKKLVLTE